MKQQELFDIYGIWHVPFWKTDWFLWITTGCIVLGTCIVGWYIARRIRDTAIPVWDRALRQLQQLQSVHIRSVQEGHEVYCQLTDIMKEYFGARYDRSIPGMTDEELLAYLPSVAFPDDCLPALEELLKAGLHIKFAGVPALAAQFKKDVAASIAMVRKTIPVKK